MKHLKYLSTLVLVVAFSSMLGCASTSNHEGTGEYIDDSVITTKVKAAVLNEPSLKTTEVNVETYKGIVQLSGFVNSDAIKRRASVIAANTSGVRQVRNDLIVK